MSKAARERTARERLAEERKRQAAKQKRTRTLLVGVAAVVVIAVVVAGAVLFKNKDDSAASGYTGPLAPTTVAADGTVTMAQPTATGPTVDLYEDFQCPICKEFEEKSGATVKKLAGQGKIKVVYHVLGFVNQQGSVRAGAAAKCAADLGRFTQFHDVAYKEQPDERTALTLDDLKGFGKKAGITGTYDKCVTDQAFAPQVQKNTTEGLKLLSAKYGQQAGTPSMLVNGEPISQNTMFEPSALERALLAAASGPSSASPSASPSASATAKK
ncbi:DsbA family protein [Actinomadura parmotrematis]|uniref:DsbA family protein n=1 Tax=Actinomadura parmotrematis TaxID=2864039 RepID=A0ABS7FL42_9ACTN|nr:thioredoxin domain-containing protein [Actinomadura parmotrematis]MBW8481081.1 DsbA family protein [Actinomadura parmotrematis]